MSGVGDSIVAVPIYTSHVAHGLCSTRYDSDDEDDNVLGSCLDFRGEETNNYQRAATTVVAI